jgi:putative alpha-1,2-mannosidase
LGSTQSIPYLVTTLLARTSTLQHTVSVFPQLTTLLLTSRPFFDSVKINFPNAKKPLEITSIGAPNNPYVKSLSVNGKSAQTAVITHEQIAQGGTLKFEMSSQPEAWASAALVG